MDVMSVKLEDISPAMYNPRRISDEDYDRLRNSIKEFGFVDPIIVNLKNMRIIGGHQRYEVLVNEYGLGEELICIPLGDIGWVFPSDDLVVNDENYEKGLNIALNKISGQWDNDKLHDLLVDLDLSGLDLDLTGFQEFEFNKLKFDLDVEFDDGFDEEGKESSSESSSSGESDLKEKFITCPCCNGEFRLSDVE